MATNIDLGQLLSFMVKAYSGWQNPTLQGVSGLPYAQYDVPKQLTDWEKLQSALRSGFNLQSQVPYPQAQKRQGSSSVLDLLMPQQAKSKGGLNFLIPWAGIFSGFKM